MEHTMEHLMNKLANTYALQRSSLSFLAEGENLIFAYKSPDNDRIIRVSGNRERQSADIEAELDFMQWLNQCGDVAVQLLPNPQGELLTQIPVDNTIYHAISYEMLERPFPGSRPWDSALFTQLGERCGLLHKASAQYQPRGPKRYSWFEDPDLVWLMSLDGEFHKIAERTRCLVSKLRELPVDTASFGLIHADLHSGNMGWDKSGQIRFYDFDDCHYGYLMQDMAVALFFSYWHPDMLEGIMRQNPQDTAHAQTFVRAFLQGYRRHASGDAVQLAALGDMLKLQRCLLWGVLHADGDERGDWDCAYRKWQKEIEDDVPFVELDFSGF